MDKQRISLEHDQLLRLERVGGWSLCCLEGRLLLSGAPPLGDVELHPGQGCCLAPGVVLVDACKGARLDLCPPETLPWWARWRSPPLVEYRTC